MSWIDDMTASILTDFYVYQSTPIDYSNKIRTQRPNWSKDMEPWQERVIQEKKELDEKIKKLANFTSDNVANIDSEQILLLFDQYRYMNDYSNVLDKRIRLIYAKLHKPYKPVWSD